MNILNLFKPKIQKQYLNGSLPDTRIAEEKAKDYLTKELFMAQPLVWEDFETWKAKPENQRMLNDIEVNNQNQSNSCAAQSSSLALAINNYIETGKFRKFSAKPIYARRRNNPDFGMYLDDVGNICISYATLYEMLYPSQNIEGQMNALDNYTSDFEAIGKVLKSKAYIWVQGGIDNYASILATGKPIIMTVIFGEHEWGNEINPQIIDATTKYGHSICGLPNAYFTYQGKKAILIQDSWGNIGWNGRRIITEEWFTQNRILFGIWFEDLNNLSVFNPQQPTIHYQWTRDLYVGCIGEDVRQLQLALATIQDENGYLFPLATQNATNYFGGITRNAVKRFQAKFGIAPVEGFVGILTRTKLNELFK